jgi:copper chaperone CopZ
MMRYVFLPSILFVLLFCGFGCNTIDKGLTVESMGKSMEESETRVYAVFGMDCPGCHGGLEKLVKKIPDVQQAEANWVEKRLAVTVQPGAELNDEDIYDAIRRANFTPGKQIK